MLVVVVVVVVVDDLVAVAVVAVVVVVVRGRVVDIEVELARVISREERKKAQILNTSR